MAGPGYNLTQRLAQSQTLAPQMRQSLKMLQMTSLDLATELRQQMTALVQTVEELETIERQARERIAKAGA